MFPPQAGLECRKFWGVIPESTIKEVWESKSGKKKPSKQVTVEGNRDSVPIDTFRETMGNTLQNCPSVSQ